MKENLHLTYINNRVVYKYHLPSEYVNQKREPFSGSELTPMRPHLFHDTLAICLRGFCPVQTNQQIIDRIILRIIQI